MIFVPIGHLKPGMILARDVYIDSNFVPFISSCQQLTVSAIEKLISNRISGVYINTRAFNDANSVELIDDESKKEVIDGLKTIFLNAVKEKSLSVSSANQALEIALDIVLQIITTDEQFFNIIDMKRYSEYIYTHALYVAVLSTLIGINIGLDNAELVELSTASLMEDIGNLFISEEILNKKTELLPSEREIIKTHTLLSVKRLRPCCAVSSKIISGVVSHHEHYDGTGYPNNLVGNDIPLFGRILALADVYDALTSDRPFRPAYSPNEAIEYMMSQSGSHFDEELLKIFLHCVTAFPVGTIVELSNGNVCIVIKNTPSYPLRPIIRSINSSDENDNINLALDSTYNNITIKKCLSDDVVLPNL
ncbi:MAG: HD-GYP domain-containing protein [Oscillospiraceae bacterium]